MREVGKYLKDDWFLKKNASRRTSSSIPRLGSICPNSVLSEENLLLGPFEKLHLEEEEEGKDWKLEEWLKSSCPLAN